MKEFFKTDTGKKVEAAMWQFLVVGISIAIVYANEFNIAWLLPLIPFLQFTTKWVNVNKIK